MRKSLEFAYNQIKTLQHSNRELKTLVTALTQQMKNVTAENKQMKETILDIQTRSMRDNLIFSGIPETSPDNPELRIQNFMTSQLKLPTDLYKILPSNNSRIKLGPSSQNLNTINKKNWSKTKTKTTQGHFWNDRSIPTGDKRKKESSLPDTKGKPRKQHTCSIGS